MTKMIKRSLAVFLMITALLMILALPGIGATPGLAGPAGRPGNWISYTAAADGRLTGVAYGNGTFVAVGERGTILTSPDGTAWTESSSGTERFLYAAAYGNGTFVAVGEAGTILTSPDGDTWTARNSGTTDTLTAVCFGNGRFVCTAIPGATETSASGTPARPKPVPEQGLAQDVLTSSDTVHWMTVCGTMDNLSGLAYGSGNFVAVGPGNAVLTSPDGSKWTRREFAFNGVDHFDSIAYGNGRFVLAERLLPHEGSLVASLDGASWDWSQSSVRLDRVINGLAYTNGVFMAVGDYGRIMTSPDGVAWTEQLHGDDLLVALAGAAYGDGRCVAVGNSYGIGYFHGLIVHSTRQATVTAGSPFPPDAVLNGSPLTVRHLRTIPGDRRVILDWDPALCATGQVTYYLYRGTSEAVDTATPLAVMTIRDNQYQYIDEHLSNGIIYYYLLKAVDQSGAPGQYYSEVAATPGQTVTVRIGLDEYLLDVNGVAVPLDPLALAETNPPRPQIVAGRIYLPLRSLMETAFWASYDWNGQRQAATIELNGQTMEFRIGQAEAQVNGIRYHLTAAPFLAGDGRPMLPLRFIAETLGASVDWDPATLTATVSYTPADSDR